MYVHRHAVETTGKIPSPSPDSFLGHCQRVTSSRKLRPVGSSPREAWWHACSYNRVQTNWPTAYSNPSNKLRETHQPHPLQREKRQSRKASTPRTQARERVRDDDAFKSPACRMCPPGAGCRCTGAVLRQAASLRQLCASQEVGQLLRAMDDRGQLLCRHLQAMRWAQAQEGGGLEARAQEGGGLEARAQEGRHLEGGQGQVLRERQLLRPRPVRQLPDLRLQLLPVLRRHVAELQGLPHREGGPVVLRAGAAASKGSEASIGGCVASRDGRIAIT